ncbi:Transposable element Tc1 transposase, partial [Choanephora cucurbitarum]
LSKQRKKNCLNLAKDRIGWLREEWAHVTWSDESRYTTEGPDDGIRVFRQAGERHKDKFMIPTIKWEKDSVMVWECFFGAGIESLVFSDGSMDQVKFIDALSEKSQPWFLELATSHTGRVACEFDCWPAQGSYLSLIEHMWSTLELRIKERRYEVYNTQKSKRLLQDEWNRIGDDDLIARLVNSMKDRCQAVIDLKGGTT